MFRFNVLTTMRAIMVGPLRLTTRSRASTTAFRIHARDSLARCPSLGRARAIDSGLTAGGRSGVVKQTHLNADGGPLQNAKGGR